MTHSLARLIASAGIGTLLAGCQTHHAPPHPTVAVMPAPNKPFEVFRADDETCQAYARQQIGVNPGAATEGRTAAGAAGGMAIGAAAGALLTGHHEGAAVGAGMGALVGASEGSESAYRSRVDLQRRYNIAYEQCMYAKGNQIPGVPAPAYNAPPPPNGYPQAPGNYAPPPPPAYYAPPPPPGSNYYPPR